MENMSIQTFPDDLCGRVPHRSNIEASLITGIFREAISAQAEHELITYIPDGADCGWPQLVLAADSKTDPVKFFKDAGIMQLANRQHFLVHILIPSGETWESEENDDKYTSAVVELINARKRYVGCSYAIYLMGVEDGTQLVTAMALKAEEAFAGLVCAGEIEAYNLSRKASSDDADPGLPVPIWFWDTGSMRASAKMLPYWMKRNHTAKTGYSGEEADEIYFPDSQIVQKSVNDMSGAPVRVTYAKKLPTYEQLEVIWSVLSSIRRQKGSGHHSLRSFQRPAGLGAVEHRLEHAGYVRRWIEYIPEGRVPDSGYPIVVTLHGRSGTAESFFDATRMWSVAQQRGFIALFPQAGCYQQFPPDGIANVSMWDYPESDLSMDNIGFIRKMIQDVSSRFKVDASRIYCCGQSSGGMMSMDLALYASDLFAAAAPWSTADFPDGRREPTAQTIPVFLMRGKNDGLPRQKKYDEYPFCCNSRVKAMLDYFLERYSIDKKPKEYVSGIYHYYIYENAKGVPLVNFIDVDDMPHASIPEESWLSYDLFLSRFSRQSDGTLLYMGRPAE